MKAYLITTVIVFGLAAALHVWVTATHLSKLSDVEFLIRGPGVGLFAAALSGWAWLLLWKLMRR